MSGAEHYKCCNVTGTAGAGRQDADDIVVGGQSDSAASGRIIEMKIK
jgi:hypothetical protein